MKFAVLLTQYFYKYKNLNLPGIGTFSIDNSYTIPDLADKNFRDIFQHIQFISKNTGQPDEALIDFIRAQTGKIRPLAISDLESYLGDGKLLLNIGKPFHIEGIGTLQKNRQGVFDFTPGEPMLERLESLTQEREGDNTPRKKTAAEANYHRPGPAPGAGSQRSLLIIGGIIVALGIIIWGGYSLYNKNTEPENTVQADSVNRVDSMTLQQADSLQQQKVFPDSGTRTTPATTEPTAPATTVAAGNYKFVLETTRYKSTALKRWDMLKPRIKLETTPDSSFFKVVMILPGTPADTTRIKDSLHNWYWGSNRLDKKVIIE